MHVHLRMGGGGGEGNRHVGKWTEETSEGTGMLLDGDRHIGKWGRETSEGTSTSASRERDKRGDRYLSKPAGMGMESSTGLHEIYG